MSTASLTTAYRPQTFADVAGQETIKAILSRAAREDRIAPAYLFSGTRGVGKTTIARIFAKSLNCVNAPAAEPCNVCEHCRKITQGMHVDVVEIDGASNRGIDDARRLRESIGYAPMEGRYKVFIIDEAHMLTRESFNALLKTLEEPPKGVTFIMATTEPHKFPITIISRCQHYIFKRLGEHELEAHLTNILGREQRAFEPQAVKLIARRAAGSVRDSMSLMGQVLALGHETLLESSVRSILGLAGQELFFKVMEAMKAQDVVAVSSVIREILDQGVDIGYFLRELATTWRNLFMLKQAGEQALPLLDLPEAEARQWLAWVPEFELSHVHACWQLTLEGQRRVLTSLEPAMALELLLLNLTFLPKLLNMEQLSRGGARPAGQQPAQGGAPRPSAPTAPQGRGPTNPFDAAAGAANQSGNMPDAPSAATGTASSFSGTQAGAMPPAGAGLAPHARRPEPPHRRAAQAAAGRDVPPSAGMPGPMDNDGPPVGYLDGPPADLPPEFGGAAGMDGPPPAPPATYDEAMSSQESAADGGQGSSPFMGHSGLNGDQAQDAEVAEAPVLDPATYAGPRNWENFLEFCKQQNGEGGRSVNILYSAKGEFSGNELRILTQSGIQYDRLNEAGLLAILNERVRQWFGPETSLAVLEPTSRVRPYAELRKEVEEHPLSRMLEEELGASLIHFRHKDEPGK
ncbi:DNA polymerase III subunit gamma/tau [Desulfovibrio mangrovi]|uniref:DNA polymerase III subunit gamma/tau n=1 Tax=Desulfovibrio mangrovi TaxID=2976983 RepID=UPI0022459B4B|nr:DNA polymerase III subunit gamma/tau [Desulfovibrio mangrovi]UZP66605.1 DNA polymerase III subunit gamma/tau [Desulfovibrio mangrovi]